MKKEVWQKILHLISRTGDRMVVVEPDTDEPYVVMDITSYTELVDALEESDEKFEWDETIIPKFNQDTTRDIKRENLTTPATSGKLETAKQIIEELGVTKKIPHVSANFEENFEEKDEEEENTEEPRFFTEPNP